MILEQWPLARLKPDPKNARTHSAKQVEVLRRSIQEFGFTNPILADPDGVIIAGHGRLRAANLANLETVAVIVLSHLSENQRRALRIADNQIATGAGWDETLLRGELEALKLEDFDLSLLGFDPPDLDKLFDPTPEPRGKGDTSDEEEPPPLEPSAAPPWVKDGALYELGAHRLLVGDSLILENRERLIGKEPVDAVITDPPYAIYGSSSGVGSSIQDDKMVVPFFEALFRACADHMREFAHLYCFHDWRSVGAIYAVLKRVPALTIKNNLVWDKGGSGLGANYANSYENVLFVHRLQPKRVMKGGEHAGIRAVNRPNILRHNRPSGAERLHNAAKPVPMLVDFCNDSTDPGGRVWEPMCGSGSTLIACEKTSRVCLAGEIDAINAQIAIERWQRLTGKKAVELEPLEAVATREA